jgi:hypothetical protein
VPEVIADAAIAIVVELAELIRPFASTLNAATDEETKTRIAEKLAILDGNAAMAEKYKLQSLENQAIQTVTDSLVILAGAAMDSAAKFKQINPFAGTQYGETGSSGFPTSTSATTSFPTITPTMYSGTSQVTNPFAGTYYGETGRDPMPISITVDTAQTGDRFAQLIAESIQIANRSGYSTSAAGQLP